MQKLILKRLITEKQADKLIGKEITEKYIKYPIINEDTDAYDNAGNLLFKFRTNAIPLNVLELGVKSFYNSIQLTESRGVASGSSHKRIKADGSQSNITVGNKVLSGSIGAMDSAAMVSYCRKTAFTKQYYDQYTEGLPFVQFVDKLYKELIPDRWAVQNMYASGTDINYVIPGSSFTTITMNKNFRTFAHRDGGDLIEGFGNLVAYRKGNWQGCYFALPEYGVGIDMQNGSVLFVDVHKVHSNTNFINFEPEKGDERISFVMYYRQSMIKCGSPSQELINIKKDKNGFYRL